MTPSRSQTPLGVTHVTLSPSRRGGGVAVYLRELARRTAQQGHRVTVLGLDDDRMQEELRDGVYEPGVQLITARPVGSRTLGFSPPLWKQLGRAIAQADIVHVHGLRTLLGAHTARLCRRDNTPLIVSPHGQLDPWLLQQRRARKFVFDRAFDRRVRTTATVLHCMSSQEAVDARKVHPDAFVSYAPIGLESAPFDPPSSGEPLAPGLPELDGRPWVFFCGVITARKGIDELAQAWSRLMPEFADWRLVIAGLDIEKGRGWAETCFANHQARERVSFLGEIDRATRDRLLATCSFLVLPTRSEAFGMIVAEALASARPVLTTRGAPWAVLNQQGLGWQVGLSVDDLVQGMRQAMSATDPQRDAMGERGRSFVKTELDWTNTLQKIEAIYRWALDRGSQPECVIRPDQPIETCNSPI